MEITKYADKLETDLDGLDWPEGTMVAQKQWIGRSKGAIIKFPILNENSKNILKFFIYKHLIVRLIDLKSETNENELIEVFTTRPDTIYGVTFLVLAPEHPLGKFNSISSLKQIAQYFILIHF